MKDMPSKISDAMYRQCKSRGYAAPVDVLMDIGVLDKAKYDDWRTGRVPFLEVVCTANLHKLSEMMKEMRSFAAKSGLKPSISSYKHTHAHGFLALYDKTVGIMRDAITDGIGQDGIANLILSAADAELRAEDGEGDLVPGFNDLQQTVGFRFL